MKRINIKMTALSGGLVGGFAGTSVGVVGSVFGLGIATGGLPLIIAGTVLGYGGVTIAADAVQGAKWLNNKVGDMRAALELIKE